MSGEPRTAIQRVGDRTTWGRGPRREIQELWFALANRRWSILVVIPVGSSAMAASVAISLADVGRRLREMPVTFLVMAESIDYPTAGRIVQDARSRRAEGRGSRGTAPSASWSSPSRPSSPSRWDWSSPRRPTPSSSASRRGTPPCPTRNGPSRSSAGNGSQAACTSSEAPKDGARRGSRGATAAGLFLGRAPLRDVLPEGVLEGQGARLGQLPDQRREVPPGGRGRGSLGGLPHGSKRAQPRQEPPARMARARRSAGPTSSSPPAPASPFPSCGSPVFAGSRRCTSSPSPA